MTYKSSTSLLFKLFSLLAAAIAGLVIVEYAIGKRGDTVEFVVAVVIMLFCLGLNFHLISLEINKHQNKLLLTGWFGLRNKKIDLSTITDLYVEHSISIDNHHSILVEVGKRRIKVFEKGGFKKDRIEAEARTIYSQLCDITGLKARAFEETSSS